MVQVILSSLTSFPGCQDNNRGHQVKFTIVQSFCKDTLGNLVRALPPSHKKKKASGNCKLNSQIFPY
jgi:hypothetical protein